MTAAHGWYALPLNAEPWTVPNLGIGRSKGRVYPTMSKAHGLVAYQEAVKEQMAHLYPDAPLIDGPIHLDFWIWRNLAEYQGAKKKVHRHAADATNVQKALEDALQGVLYENDSAVRRVQTFFMAQGPEVEPLILIRVAPDLLPTAPRWVEKAAWTLMAAWPAPQLVPADPARAYMDIEAIF